MVSVSDLIKCVYETFCFDILHCFLAPNGYPGGPPSYPGSGYSQPPQMNANWAPPSGPPMGYPPGSSANGGYSSGPAVGGYPAGPAGGASGYPAWGNPSYQQQASGGVYPSMSPSLAGGYAQPMPGAGPAGYQSVPLAGAMGFGGPSVPGQSI